MSSFRLKALIGTLALLGAGVIVANASYLDSPASANPAGARAQTAVAPQVASQAGGLQVGPTQTLAMSATPAAALFSVERSAQKPAFAKETFQPQEWLLVLTGAFLIGAIAYRRAGSALE